LNIPFHIPYLSGKETDFIAKVIAKNEFSGNGYFHKQATRLLQKITGTKNIFLTTSCTSALEISALALDIQPGDEVILPSFTFVSTANAFALRSARLRFADIDRHSLNISISEIERLYTSKTKAIVVVHYNGYSDTIDQIAGFAQQHHIALIEDAAQSISGFYRQQHLGTFGDLGCISFHETKNIHCGEGGCLLVNNAHWLERVAQIMEKGTDRNAFLQGKTPFYQWQRLGLSADMDEIRAAFLTAQLTETENVTRRRKNNMIKNLQILQQHQNDLLLYYLPEANYFKQTNGHILWALSSNHNETITRLAQKGIAAVSHYTPLHLSNFGKQFYEQPLPVTEQIARDLVRFPVHITFTL